MAAITNSAATIPKSTSARSKTRRATGVSTAKPTICASPPTAWPMAFARAQLPAGHDRGQDRAFGGGDEGRDDRKKDCDDVEGARPAGLDDVGHADGGAGEVAERDDEAAGDGVGGDAGNDPRNHHGHNEGEDEEAGVEGLSSGVEDEEDEREVEGVLGDAARKKREELRAAEGELLEEGRGPRSLGDVLPGGGGAHEAAETRDFARCSKRRRSSITRRPHSRQTSPMSAPTR